ncbi:MAG: Mu transposase C-terminal domain-containing protein, partial [Candidatus Dormibacteraceae bacterium]
LGQSPREAYEQSLLRDGERDHKRIPYDEVFKRATFPTTDRGQGLVQPGKGVRMNYLDYWCDEMRDRDVERTQVKVRYDPFDVTTAYAFVRGQWRKCVCATDELSGCSERELQILAEELRKRNRLQYGREQVEITQKQLAIFRRENAAMEVLLRQQRHDRETKAAFLVLEGGRGGRRVPNPATPPAHLSPMKEKDPHDQANEPAPRRSGQAAGDGDNLIVLRRVRS